MVIEFIRVHGAHHQKVVGDGPEVRNDVAELHAALPVFLEGAFGSLEYGGGWLDEGEASLVEDALGEALPGHFIELGLGVEEIDLGGSPRHEDEDAGLGFGVEMRLARSQRVLESSFGSRQESIVSQ